MATTTPNYGWAVPTSTDLVKDGATAIEILGDSIDASFKSQGNFELLNAGGTALTGAATITVSGISNKSKLYIYIASMSSANASSGFTLRFNADSGNNYQYGFYGITSATPYTDFQAAGSSQFLAVQGNNAANASSVAMVVWGANNTGYKPYTLNTHGNGTGIIAGSMTGAYFGSSAISSVSVLSGSGNFDAGTIYVYGAL